MTRPLRIEYPGAWYHVMNRGRHRERVYHDEIDYATYLEVLSQCCERFNLEVHAYSLMPNHYHLLVRTPEGNLSRVMRHLDGVYTQKYNRRHKLDGSLFRGRYKAILVEEDVYLKQLVRYIHQNPWKAGLEEAVGQHEWTSHRYYIKKRNRPEWLERKFILKYFGKREKEAERKLDAYVKEEASKEFNKRLDGVNWPSMIGGEKFKGWVKDQFLGEKLDDRELSRVKKQNTLTIEKCLEVACKLLKCEEVEICKSKRGSENYKRRAFIYWSKKEHGILNREIGMILGVGYATISQQYSLAEEEVRKRNGCWKLVRLLK